MKIPKSMPIVIACRFVLEELSDRLLQRITSSPSRNRTGKGLILSSPSMRTYRRILSIVASFTPRLKAFQKLKEISLEKCDWLRLFHPIQQRSVRPLHLLPLSLFLPFFPSFSVTCNNRERGWSTPVESRAKKGTKRKRTERKRSCTVDRERRTKGEKGSSSAEWNPFRNCKPPCSIPFLHRLPSWHPPAAFSRLLPSGKATPPARLTPPVSLSISPARSLSGDSVLASNTDIEQSPFSLKPSSHQE